MISVSFDNIMIKISVHYRFLSIPIGSIYSS